MSKRFLSSSAALETLFPPVRSPCPAWMVFTLSYPILVCSVIPWRTSLFLRGNKGGVDLGARRCGRARRSGEGTLRWACIVWEKRLQLKKIRRNPLKNPQHGRNQRLSFRLSYQEIEKISFWHQIFKGAWARGPGEHHTSTLVSSGPIWSYQEGRAKDACSSYAGKEHCSNSTKEG